MKNPRNLVGPQIRKLRSEQRLTQPMLAARCRRWGWDLSRETLAKIESQLRWVADFELICLAKALPVEPKDLWPAQLRDWRKPAQQRPNETRTKSRAKKNKGHVETKLLETSLSLYLSPIQVKQILKQPDLLKPGAVQKTVSILFSDIANFSKISERMDPDDLVKLLNNYYETAISCIHKTEGTVMNLIGDAILAIWNAPQDQKDHQARACQAALLLNESLIRFDLNNRNLPLRTRVGLHTGIVCVGNIGSATHFDYTAIGESVNMASRLEGLNKQLGTNILATRDMQKSVENQLISRLVGHFRFKGFDQVVQVHELIGGLEDNSEKETWREIFETALHRFQRSAFDEAQRGFCETLKYKPNDGPSKFYLERISELRLRSLPSDWAGEIDLREK